MDDADARAVAGGLLRAASWLAVLWGPVVTAPLLIGGLTRGEAVYSAGMALVLVALFHFIRMVSARGPVAQSGPLAGLRPAQSAEVTAAVRGGRAVSDPRLAEAAVGWAQQRLRRESVGRIGLPVVLVLWLVSSFADGGERRVPIAYRAVIGAPLVVFWVLDLVGYRRSHSSEARNLRLLADLAGGGFRPHGGRNAESWGIPLRPGLVGGRGAPAWDGIGRFVRVLR